MKNVKTVEQASVLLSSANFNKRLNPDALVRIAPQEAGGDRTENGSSLIEIKNAKTVGQTPLLLVLGSFNKGTFRVPTATANCSQIGTAVFSRISLRIFSASAVRLLRAEARELTMMR